MSNIIQFPNGKARPARSTKAKRDPRFVDPPRLHPLPLPGEHDSRPLSESETLMEILRSGDLAQANELFPGNPKAAEFYLKMNYETMRTALTGIYTVLMDHAER